MARSTKGSEALASWIYPKGSGIRIREILNNHEGSTFGGSYLVTVPSKITGGLRDRKQFKDKASAQEYAEKAFQGFKKQGNEYFNLTDGERREVAVGVPRLRELGISITEAIDFAVKRLSASGKGKTAAEIVAELVASKEQRFERGDLRARSLQDFKQRSERFVEAFQKKPAAEISGQHIKDWLNTQKNGPRSNRNYINVVGEIFRYAVQKRYVSLSPIDELTDVDRKELCGNGGQAVEPSILTPDQAEKLLRMAQAHPDLDLLAAVTLGLFCGLRTEELKRLDWQSVRLGDAQPVVTIGAKIAKKRRIRHVDIPPNAVLWLRLCARPSGPVAEEPNVSTFQKRFRKLQIFAGFGRTDSKGRWFSTWENNAMRHSFGSYHYAAHGDPLATSRLLGHKASDEVLFDHYRALATKENALKYFGIKPAPSKGKVVAFTAS